MRVFFLIKELITNFYFTFFQFKIIIASYGKDLDNDINLVDVIERVNNIKGLKRIRLGSIEPRILTLDNIKRMARCDKLCPHFHISLQSGSAGVLKRMNRRGTGDEIRSLFNNVEYTSIEEVIRERT